MLERADTALMHDTAAACMLATAFCCPPRPLPLLCRLYTCPSYARPSCAVGEEAASAAAAGAVALAQQQQGQQDGNGAASLASASLAAVRDRVGLDSLASLSRWSARGENLTGQKLELI